MKAGLWVFLLSGCAGVPGLTSEDVFGLAPNPKVWLSGLVTNARSGAPITPASLQVSGASTTTDSAGAYRIDGLTPGDVQLSATADGFAVLELPVPLHAGANVRDLALQPLACGAYRCATDEYCDGANGACLKAAALTGSVVSACDGRSLDGRVTIGGRSTCASSHSGKSYFMLSDLAPGPMQTLAVGKTGYQAFSTTVTLVPGFNAAPDLRLIPIGGCTAMVVDVACECTQSTCEP